MEAWPWVPALTTWQSGGRSLPISSIKFTRVDKMQRHGDVINVRWSDSYIGSILDLDICAASPHSLAHTRALARVIGTFLICTGRAAEPLSTRFPTLADFGNTARAHHICIYIYFVDVFPDLRVILGISCYLVFPSDKLYQHESE